MKMTSMKRSAADKKESQETATIGPGAQEDYPYGLVVRLGDDELEKLGMGTLPAVGEEYMMMATARVRSVSASDREDGGKHRDLELQITDMALARQSSSNAADTLYPGKKPG